jgi:membrane-bound lytic murein transglycosylase D
MKKTILILLGSFVLVSCQQPGNIKTNNVTDNHQFTTTNADEIVQKLNACQSDSTCKIELDTKLNDWLMLNQQIGQQVNENEAHIEEQKNLSAENEANIIELEKFNDFVLSNDYLKNDLVKGALNEWLTWKRPQLISTWEYYQFLKEDMWQEFEQQGIDEALILAILAQESGGKVHSSSKAGAGGLFQIMPATAKRLGISGKLGEYDLRFNPAQSAKAAALYIAEQSQLYSGDVTKILAAYNSGENRMARLNKIYKNSSIWEKGFFYELPRETRHYIPVVVAAMLIFQSPEKFNVKLPEVETSRSKIKLTHESSLSELAVCLGQDFRQLGWFRILRNLNSGIKADKVIAANTELLIPAVIQPTFDKNCKNKELMSFAHTLHLADFKHKQGLFNYRVKKGDSLHRIVSKYSCTSKQEIARLNNLKAPRYLIREGKYLKIPQC